MIADTDETGVAARATKEQRISIVGQEGKESGRGGRGKDEGERKVETNIGGTLLGTKGSLSLPNNVTGKTKELSVASDGARATPHFYRSVSFKSAPILCPTIPAAGQ